MSGPNAEDGYGATDDEVRRILRREMDQIRREADLMYGLHHEPPTSLAYDDDEGVGAEDGE